MTKSRANLTNGELLSDFHGHLDAEECVLTKLVAVLNEMRSLLIRNAADELARLSDQSGTLLTESQQLAAVRSEFLQELARRFDLHGDELTLQRVAEVAGPAGAWLLATRDRLAGLTKDVNRINRQNAAIIVRAADQAREVVRRLTNAEPGDSYDADGIREEPSGGSMFNVDG